ncbi:TPA: hypothetical protein PMB21_002102 [Vibrio cholerae]|nr:hypothetical protein [Vibrio cholerae]
MKTMQLTTLVACTALGLFGAMGYAQATDSLSSPISSVSTQASEVALGPASAIQVIDNEGARLVVKATALKNLYNTLFISYYNAQGQLQAQDEYGYGTHDIDHLLSVNEIKSFSLPSETILISIKDESGAVLTSKSTEINNIHM